LHKKTKVNNNNILELSTYMYMKH